MAELKKDDYDVYSEGVGDILSDPPKSIFLWGNTVFFIFMVVLLLLSWFIKYPDTIKTQAILTTEVPPQKEFARVTGKVDSIFVKNYERVNEGTPLALIENSANYHDVVYLKSILDTLTVNKDDFKFPLDNLPLLFLGDMEVEFSNFENTYTQYRLYKDLGSFNSDNHTNEYTLSQLQIRLKNLILQKGIYEKELEFIQHDLDRIEILYRKKVISQQELETKKMDKLQADRNLKNALVTISQVRERIEIAKNTKKQSEISNTREVISLLKSTIQSYDLLKKSIRDWEIKYVFKSDIQGAVSFMDVWNVNQTVEINQLVFTVIPNKIGTYLAKIKAPILNSSKLKLRQTVNIHLDSYPDREFGVLKGKISEISLIPNKEGMYLLDVSLPDKLITSYGKEITFRHEISGTAEIITEDKRLIERIFYQFREIFRNE